jgi:hypothetical protein
LLSTISCNNALNWTTTALQTSILKSKLHEISTSQYMETRSLFFSIFWFCLTKKFNYFQKSVEIWYNLLLKKMLNLKLL